MNGDHPGMVEANRLWLSRCAPAVPSGRTFAAAPFGYHNPQGHVLLQRNVLARR
jgi:hypothetical protein